MYHLPCLNHPIANTADLINGPAQHISVKQQIGSEAALVLLDVKRSALIGKPSVLHEGHMISGRYMEGLACI